MFKKSRMCFFLCEAANHKQLGCLLPTGATEEVISPALELNFMKYLEAAVGALSFALSHTPFPT